MRLRVVAVAALLLGGLFIIEGGAARAATVSIPVTYRDFDHDAKVNAPNAHPDFETMDGDDKGIVQEMLGSDGKPVYNSADTNDTVTSAASFNQWFHDDATVNKSVAGTLDMTESGGEVTFDDQDFFPVDGKGWNDPAVGNGTGQVDGEHNFSFTMEMHMTFTYGAGQHFEFTGDDDVFVFFNKHLEIDLGGVHGAENSIVNLDDAGPGDGMTAGNQYPIDIFFAERHTSGSSFAINADFSVAPQQDPNPTTTTSTTTTTLSTTSTTAAATTSTTTAVVRATTTTTRAVGNATIRRTGTESGPLTTAGAGLLLVGAFLGLVGRRRATDGRHFL
jgi:fibro-slime domain-containing protein